MTEDVEAALRRLGVVGYASDGDGSEAPRRTFRQPPRPAALRICNFLQSNCFGALSQQERKAAARHANGDTGTVAMDRIASQRLGRASGGLDDAMLLLPSFRVPSSTHRALAGSWKNPH